MKITSPKLETSHLTRNAEVSLRCQTALEQKEIGNYYGAQSVMHPLWQRLGDRPDTAGLQPQVAAELLLCVGILTCWIASKDQSKVGQETAKDLITESIAFYESINDVKTVAAARVELAACYWYEGELDEARIILTEALEKLTAEGNTRARALIGLAIVEWSAARYDDALAVLTDNAPLFKKITSHTTKAIYHNQLAMILREIAKAETGTESLRRAVSEYKEADSHLKHTRNVFFRADLKNNVGNALRQLNRFREAHKYLAEARRLAVSVKDKLRIGQIDETRAQVFIAEGKFAEAERVAKGVVSVFSKTDRHVLLAEALITHGIALARLRHVDRAQLAFQEAIEAAYHVGAFSKAGLASLTMIEELELPNKDARAAFLKACDWLSECQSTALLLRLIKAAVGVVARLGEELDSEQATEIVLTKFPNLQDAVIEYERALIRQALSKVNGSVTRAASLVGLSHQGLAYVIQSRHKVLLKERTPVIPRKPRKG